MKKTKLTRGLLAACSIVALSVVLSGCLHSGDDPPAMTEEEACVADGGTYADGTCTTAEDMAAEMLKMQTMAITDAIAAARTAVAAVNNAATDAQVSAADAAVAAAAKAITDATAVSADAKAGYTTAVETLTSTLASAKTARQMAKDADQRAADMAMAATAAKLYAGLEHGLGNTTETRTAAYNDADAPTTGTAADTLIMVTSGTAADSPVAVALSEDKKTMVAANHGWAGKRYTRTSPASEGTYEAVVYSNIAAPTPGKKFGSAAATTPTGAYEYQLTAGALAVDTSTAGVPARVALTGVTRTAGTETFNLPDPNTGGATIINVPGSYHGVSGTYNCTPSTPADGCSASVAAMGFTLAGGTWTFTPSNAEARVTEAADTAYASYGWWLHKSADDSTYTASAFHDVKGEPTALVDATLNALQGTATYMGGAAGKYALSSSTGGTNDAGHFTARATLEADFGDETAGGTITGTIDNFMGADGMARDWSVELKEGTIGAVAAGAAPINRTADDDTVWTIGGTAAAASGEWSGALRNQGTDGVPQVATGTFYTEYGTAGRMVGAFGANKQ